MINTSSAASRRKTSLFEIFPQHQTPQTGKKSPTTTTPISPTPPNPNPQIPTTPNPTQNPSPPLSKSPKLTPVTLSSSFPSSSPTNPSFRTNSASRFEIKDLTHEVEQKSGPDDDRKEAKSFEEQRREQLKSAQGNLSEEDDFEEDPKGEAAEDENVMKFYSIQENSPESGIEKTIKFHFKLFDFFNY